MRKKTENLLFCVLGIICALTIVFLLTVISVNAAEHELKATWTEYSEPSLISHFELYESDVSGGPYTLIHGDIIPTTTNEVLHLFTGLPDGVSTTRYYILRGIVPDGINNAESNEAEFTFDFGPIIAAQNFNVMANQYDVTLLWDQTDVDRVKEWKIYMAEVSGGPYTDLVTISYTGVPGEQYSTVQTMSITPGTTQTFYFVLVTFSKFGVSSLDSNETQVTINDTVPEQIYNFQLKFVTE